MMNNVCSDTPSDDPIGLVTICPAEAGPSVCSLSFLSFPDDVF